MTIRHLKIFIAVCDCGGASGAARTLHLAQPAVSQAVADLEKAYGVILFDRIKQRMVLTDMGKDLLVKAREIVELFEDFEELAISGSADKSVRIGCSLTIGKNFMPAYVKALKETIPGIEPYVIIDQTSVIEAAIESGELDFGFVEGNVLSANIEKIPFGKDRIAAVCKNGIDISQRLSMEELISYPLFLREKGSASRDMFDRELANMGLHVQPQVESASNQSLIALVEAGLGIAVLPENLVKEKLESGELFRIEIDGVCMDRVHYVLIRKNKRLSPIQAAAYEQYRNV